VTSLVLDTTALSHFTRADRLHELQIAVADDEPVLLAEVAAELARGVISYPSLGRASAAGWLKRVELQELPELAAFARYKGELGGGPERNNGEAAVLAWTSVNGGIAIIDERVDYIRVPDSKSARVAELIGQRTCLAAQRGCRLVADLRPDPAAVGGKEPAQSPRIASGQVLRRRLRGDHGCATSQVLCGAQDSHG
jgi:hypothetical protein